MNKRTFLQGILCMGIIGRAAATGAQTSVDPALERYRRLQGALLTSRRLDYTERDVHITAPRLRAHVVEVGRGEPLLLLHGGNGVGAHWLPLLVRLPGRRLIVPDRPGCGLTHGFIYDGVDMRSHGVGFVAGVLDALHVERTSVIGNSMGGYWALCFALAHPDRVHKLILAGGPAFSAGYQPMSAEAIEARVKGSRQPGRAGLGALMADPGRMPDDLLELLDTALTLPGGEESWRSIWRSARPDRTTFALHPELAGLRTPTLLIWGEQDRIDPPQPAAIAIAQRLPNARLVLMPDAGHLPWLDKPEECATLVTEFLAQA
jgi:pimeloyl-ACP methyl ester carboxylesterase